MKVLNINTDRSALAELIAYLISQKVIETLSYRNIYINICVKERKRSDKKWVFIW